MTADDIVKLHEETCSKARGIIKAKNQDYRGGQDDPFGNFRAAEFLNVPAEIGILIRSMDKFKRIQAFVVNGTLAVKSESVDDAIEDVINYMILLKAIIQSRGAGTM